MHIKTLPQEYNAFYEEQTVFLTGGTGGLGTCLLYKLSVELPTKKIFVLVRSVDKALQTWGNLIPDQLDAILNSGKIVFVTGDLCKENLGIERAILAQIIDEVAVFINSAANTSWTSTLSQAVADNCLSALNAATVASFFAHLKHFIQVSSAYCTTFLPEGLVSEAIHSFYDPEDELRTIALSGTSPHASRFPWHYAYSKHLSELLLLSRFPNLPVLIVRPSSIGSAVRSPYIGYGPTKAIPGEMFWRLHALNPGNGVFPAALGSKSGTNIFDEVPVDWVSNIILLHAANATRGVVHATAGTFVLRTLNDNAELYRADSDRDIVWTSDPRAKTSPTVAFFKLTAGDWRFETSRSEWCKRVEGPLRVDMKDVNLPLYDLVRRRKVRTDISVALEKKRRRFQAARARAVISDTLVGRDEFVQRESKL